MTLNASSNTVVLAQHYGGHVVTAGSQIGIYIARIFGKITILLN